MIVFECVIKTDWTIYFTSLMLISKVISGNKVSNNDFYIRLKRLNSAFSLCMKLLYVTVASEPDFIKARLFGGTKSF